MPFYKMIVPTVDTVRYQYLVNALMSAQQPVMLVGPVGTGKTSVAQSVLNQFDKRYYSVLTINMSAQVRVVIFRRILKTITSTVRVHVRPSTCCLF